MPKVRLGADAAVVVPGYAFPLRGRIQRIALASEQVDPGVMVASTFQGLRAPVFYVATMPLSNSQRALRDGMTGTAKIFAQRRSILGLCLEQVRDFVQRKIW